MLPTCKRCGNAIDYEPQYINGLPYHKFCEIKEKKMEPKKISIIDKIVLNRKIIIKRTLQIGGGILGVVLLGSFLAKDRFEDIGDGVEEIEDAEVVGEEPEED